ncbi:GNAT family N-acetyltransferase [Dactylosporangium sp. AC04546]|uniref:GNAT family N-acetyltransferase n=1 Tax=Dactylosporangium sp. AC04546 TaxID=2862460 RepID=UPI001EDCC492|nr:GNAT family N-acetyltransferase [Dactylosporangium sp. AC04546]WVK88106.1 GNAT family N-acetyltransferase [Dactylosporangium sp. AC04546]
MTDFHERPYRDGDAAAVAELINTVAAAGGGPGGHAPSDVDDVVRHEVAEPSADTLLVLDGDGRLAGVGLVPLPPAGGHRLELIGGVHPDRRGGGLGRRVLAWQLERAAARHAEVAPEASWAGQVVTGVADVPALRLYERFGFTVARHFLEMSAPTAPPPTVAPIDGLRIQQYRRSDERQVHALHTAAFQGLWGFQERAFDAWAALTVASATFRPELSRIAVAGDTLVGYLLAYGSDTPSRLYIGQLGTDAPWRRRGIASALLADVLDAAGRTGYTHAALDADADNPTGAVATYARSGFTVDHHVIAFHRPV